MTRNMPYRATEPNGRDETFDIIDTHELPQSSSAPNPRSQTHTKPRKQAGSKKPRAANRSYESFDPRDFALPFCKFLTNNPTVFHAVDRVAKQLSKNGFEKLSERQEWKLEKGGKYFVERNGSSLVAFSVGSEYKPGNGISMIAGHVDAITVKVKPIPGLETSEGFVQLGVAPYAGGLSSTWLDRDLGIGGKVVVKDESGKITTKLVNLDRPIARVPTLAVHFGAISQPPFNPETQLVPIVGIDNSDLSSTSGKHAEQKPCGDSGTFASTQPPRLVKAVSEAIGVKDYNTLLSWELELYDVQGSNLGGFDNEFIFGGRIDDKLCSWAAVQALLGSVATTPEKSPGNIKLVGLFDNEEIGSLTRQGAHGNFLPATISRVVESFADSPSPSILARTYANSFLVSADVCHAFNPNFANAYLKNHSPRLNVGVAVSFDPNGHMTTDSVSTAFFESVAKKSSSILQPFQIRNDSRSGGTVGPMLSSAMGCRAIDAGIVQLSMHSIRATTGADDPGLGVKLFKGFYDFYEEIDASFP